MSLDFPYYEELRRRRHPAAHWWRVGDILYYLGLLPALAALTCLPFGLGRGILGSGWSLLWMALEVFGVGAATCVIGGAAKSRAYEMGERDGISAKEVYERGREPAHDEGAGRET